MPQPCRGLVFPHTPTPHPKPPPCFSRRYAAVAKRLRESGAVFRTLALSATAGVDLSAVQRVVDLLHLSQVSLLTEDDPELLAHTHIKHVEVRAVER